MLEGKKISELETVNNLSLGSCFPVLSKGATKRITFSTLLNEIENQLPESDIEEVKEDVAKLKTRADEASANISSLNIDVENVKETVADVDEMVAGQNATIRNCVSTVETLEQTIEQTHFDDVLALEEQVRANTVNIEKKLNNTTDPANAGKVVKVDEDGALVFGEGGGGGSALVPSITQSEYNDLSEEEKTNGQIREITDAEGYPVPFAILNDELTTSANVLSAQETVSRLNSAMAELENNLEEKYFQYSTEEKIVGKWIDGSDVFRKSYYGLVNTSSDLLLDARLTNSNYGLIKCEGSAKISDGNVLQMGYSGSNDISLILRADGLVITAGYTKREYWITVDYIKKTS